MTFETYLEDLDSENVRGVFRHEDGSLSIVRWDDNPTNPRDDAETFATLVLSGNARRFKPLDDADGDIRDAWDRWNGNAREEIRDAYVTRYLAIFRPDVHAFRTWEAIGTSQSDWCDGYAYTTDADLDRAGVTREGAGELVAGEVREFGAYFAGDVYYAETVHKGAPIVTYGDHGAFVDAHDADVEIVGGFVGDQPNGVQYVAHDVNASPVVEEINA